MLQTQDIDKKAEFVQHDRKNIVVFYCNYIVDCNTRKFVDCKKIVAKINKFGEQADTNELYFFI